MASKIIPALLLMGFMFLVIITFHPTPLQSVSLSGMVTHKKPVPNPDIKCYWMVFLKTGPHRDQNMEDAAKIQSAHLQNITRLAKAGKLITAGPFGNDGDLKGMFILNCKDSLEAVQLVESDPAVKAGRLRFEVLPWWTERNCLFK
ncbi:YciI family protein [Chitinophaga sp. HK235]|uniref:YciI family protein n=1 Tax=Chitinophaga sp. HK235 TaxID=2952571 RepID=UPI001BA7CAE2|nr:YciI family protein [Chitinophaga sp. HK235]